MSAPAYIINASLGHSQNAYQYLLPQINATKNVALNLLASEPLGASHNQKQHRSKSLKYKNCKSYNKSAITSADYWPFPKQRSIHPKNTFIGSLIRILPYVIIHNNRRTLIKNIQIKAWGSTCCNSMSLSLAPKVACPWVLRCSKTGKTRLHSRFILDQE